MLFYDGIFANFMPSFNKKLSMKNILLAFVSISLFIACGPKNSKTLADGSPRPEGTYGEVITADGAIDIDQLNEKLAGKDTVDIKVKAIVSSVCQVKGCWMELVGSDESVEPVFVKFKDYGFFMPLDFAGSEVVVRGKAYRSITPVDELKHYAEDEGLSQEEIDAITEPKEELKFMADGVVLVKKG